MASPVASDRQRRARSAGPPVRSKLDAHEAFIAALKRDRARSRAGPAGRRETAPAWFAGQLDLDPTRLIFIDETGANTNMARLRGRPARGERCRAGVPHGRWRSTTFTAGIRVDALVAPFVLDGAMDADAFRAYVASVLVPELRPGDVVIMDNLATLEVEGVRQAIEAAGASLLYLPPYSPDFNPIEKAFAKLSPRPRPGPE